MVKIKNNKGILFGIKENSLKNYIDVSDYFSRVHFANFNIADYSTGLNLGVISLQKVTSDMKVLFHGYTIKNNTTKTIHFEEPVNAQAVPVTYFIVGTLKN